MASSSNMSGEKGTADPSSGSISESICPEEMCIICFGSFKEKCYAYPCMHEFCFNCLCKWSQIKPKCPLCTQPLQEILHNVRTISDYDCYYVNRSGPIPELLADDSALADGSPPAVGNIGANLPAGLYSSMTRRNQSRRQKQQRLRQFLRGYCPQLHRSWKNRVGQSQTNMKKF